MAADVAAIVLAAGASRRYGANKLLAGIHGTPLIRITVALVRRSVANNVIVVTGFESDLVRHAIGPVPVRFADNPDFSSGMGGSVAAGAAMLGSQCEAAVIVLGDQPVEPALIDALVQLQLASGLPIAAPVFRGARRHPVVFAQSIFPELRGLTGHAGARTLIDTEPARVARLELDQPVPPDLDVPGERDALARSLIDRGLA